VVVILVVVALLLFTNCRPNENSPSGVPPELLAPNPLLGKPAPSFVTVDPNGGTVDLKEHLGKNVIMLDYWATWCGPCILAMPEIAAIAQKYKDRGLVFYGVNEGEDPDTVKDFLARANLEIPVAMDFDGRIHAMFKGEYLPHTVLIGKDGSIQASHLGFSGDLAEELSQEIEQLLDGKSLVRRSSGE
jgi:thiol-disulfide isomerase/thioredoxin